MFTKIDLTSGKADLLKSLQAFIGFSVFDQSNIL